MRHLLLILLACVAVPTGLAAQPASDLASLQRQDAHLFAVGWRLARANAPYCRDTVPSIGLLLHDATTYGRPDQVRAAFGLVGDIGVQAVAPGSPAEAAGIRPNVTLVSVEDLAVEEVAPSEPSYQRLIDLQDAIDVELALASPAAVTWVGGAGDSLQTARIAPVPVCRSRFEVHDTGKGGAAEGSRVIFGRRFPGFDYAEDEFAAAVAHELAHNLLGHRALLDAEGRSQGLVRKTERDADRLMPWLLHNAGYDPRAALRFMERWGPAHGGGLLRNRTHDGWDERVAFIAAEIAAMEPLVAGDGEADWSRHFRAEATAAGAD